MSEPIAVVLMLCLDKPVEGITELQEACAECGCPVYRQSVRDAFILDAPSQLPPSDATYRYLCVNCGVKGGVPGAASMKALLYCDHENAEWRLCVGFQAGRGGIPLPGPPRCAECIKLIEMPLVKAISTKLFPQLRGLPLTFYWARDIDLQRELERRAPKPDINFNTRLKG